MGREQNCYPRFHFAAKYGWINDPNGLIYHDGVYEIYFQYNPYGTQWGNMTWGHARTRDFLSYEELAPVLHPDENGTMFSGCGIINERGLLGLPKEALLLFYTAAGGTNPESAGKEFTIRMAYSLDGGNTYIKCGEPVLESLAAENRDPKVFWHEESQAYILVLWLENEDFAIFRSTDLKQFTLSQRLTLESGFECPDLFYLPVEGSEEYKWVFWAADGSYYVGDFDGYQFTQAQERKIAYERITENGEEKPSFAYAAQTYFGVGDKVMSVPWLKTECIAEQTTGMLGLPRYFSLKRTEAGYVLRQVLPEFVRKGLDRMTASEAAGVVCSDSQKDWVEALEKGTGLEVEYEPLKSTLMLRSLRREIVLEAVEAEKLDIIYDRGVVEISAADNTRVFYCDFPEIREVWN